ncbi:hypothetical protein ACFL2K_03430 [Candidatus Margulisiibacteriota bacterium]
MLPRVNTFLFPELVRSYYQVSILLFLPIIGILGILASIYILIKRFLFKKKKHIIATAFLIMFITTIISFPPFFIAYKYLPIALPSGSHKMKFESNSWKNYKNRQLMLKDLVKKVLPNKNQKEIIAILGTSLKTDYFRYFDKDFIYFTGPQRDSFFALDSEWLLIWVDEKGIFKKYQIVND